MRTEQEICIMDLEETRKVLLLYAIINIIAPFWKGRKKNHISVIFILPYCYIMLYSDHPQLEWNYCVLDSDELPKSSVFPL